MGLGYNQNKGNYSDMGSQVNFQGMLDFQEKMRAREAGSMFGEGGFGANMGTMSALGTGVQGLGSLASMYFGNKQMNLAEDQYNTNKDFGNRNIANQAQTTNNSMEARYRAAMAANGVNTNTGAGKEGLDSYLARSKVDGSAIG